MPCCDQSQQQKKEKKRCDSACAVNGACYYIPMNNKELAAKMHEADNARRECQRLAKTLKGKAKLAMLAKADAHEAEAERLYALIMGE